MIQHIPDIAIHRVSSGPILIHLDPCMNLQRYAYKSVVSLRFTKPVILQEVASLEILGDNSLYYKTRSEVTLMCGGMEFSLYPLDHHVCNFMLSSCEY